MDKGEKETLTLLTVEDSLARSKPFGDWEYINECLWTRYNRRLEMLAEHFHVANILLESLRKASSQNRFLVLGDPLVRMAIDTALGHFKIKAGHVSLEDLEAVLSIAADHLKDNKCVSPLEAGACQSIRIVTPSHHAWIWCEERTEDVLGQIFYRLFKQHVVGLTLRTPDEHVQKMLVSGSQLLNRLLPELACSALNHVYLVAVVDSNSPKFTSVTHPGIPGTIFLSPSVLKTPWQAAEYLLHEALHQKFIDLEHTHSMLRRNYQVTEDSPLIRPLWNRGRPNKSISWSIDRALTVCHVYTCLALFFTVVERRSTEFEKLYGSLNNLDPIISARRAFDRAHYLSHELKQFDQELGLAGRRCVNWLTDILNIFDPYPPQSGSYVHLLLDLYEREAKELRDLLQVITEQKLLTTFKNSDIQENIVHMIETEVAKTRHILLIFSKALTTSFPSFYSEESKLKMVHNNETPTEIITKFLSVRASVSQILMKVLLIADSSFYQIQGMEIPSDLVQEMVEYSGTHFNIVIEHLSSP